MLNTHCILLRITIMKIISSITEFDKIKNENKGFIVITTQTRGFDVLHGVCCPYIMKKHFIKKVNSKSRGNYQWFESISNVKKEFSDLRDCKQCNPLSIKLRFD